MCSTTRRLATGTRHALSVRMSKLLVASAAMIGAACSTPPSGGTPIALHATSGTPVDGSAFQCTGSWPSSMTPCDYPWSSSPVADATDDGNGLVHLILHRNPIPVDGGASTVYLDLQFGVEGQISPTAWEETTRAGNLATVETSEPTDGWIEPVVTGRTAHLRNAGRFSLTFAWGSIAGTYDTAPPQP
jgi:hypothetical protein